MAKEIRFRLVVEDDGSVAVEKFADSFKLVDREISKAEGSLKRYSKTEDRVIKTTNEFRDALKSVIAQMTALAGIAGAGYLTRSILETGASFEKMMKIVKGVMRATPEEFKRLTEIARKMGEETEWSASQAAQALQYLGMAGFNAEQAIKALPGVLDLATAGNIDLGRAADIASNALTAMGLKVEELSRVNDVLIATITRTNTNMEMMAESFKYAAPVAKGFGYDIETLAALIGMLGNAGIQGSMAGTQLAFAFQQVGKVWEELGLKGYGGDLIQALEAIKKASWDTQKIMDVFGERGGRAVLALLDNVDALKKLIRELKESRGESKRLADEIRSSVIGEFQSLKSVIESYAIDVFEKYKDTIKDVLESTTKWLREHKEDFLKTIESIGDTLKSSAEATEDLVSGISKLISLLKSIKKDFLSDSDVVKFGLINLALYGKWGVPGFAVGAATQIYSEYKKGKEWEEKKKSLPSAIGQRATAYNVLRLRGTNEEVLRILFPEMYQRSKVSTLSKAELKKEEREKVKEVVETESKIDSILKRIRKKREEGEKEGERKRIREVKESILEQLEAYKTMYETLRKWGYSEYEIQAKLIEERKKKFIEATKDKVLAERWASAELQKAWEEDRLRFGGFADGIIVAYERMKRSATSFAKMAYDSFYGFVNNARRTFSDLFYDTFTGKLKSLKDYWESFWHSMLRIFSDKLAEMVVNWMLGIKRMQEGISGGSGLVRAIAGVTGTSVTTLSAIKAAGGGSSVGVGSLGVAGGLLGKIFTAPSMLEANWVFRALSKIPGVQVIRMPEGAVLAVNGVPLAKILSSAGWASLGYGILGKLVGLPSGTIPAITSTAGAIGGGLAGASLIGGSLGGPVGAGIGALLGGALGGLFGGKHHPGKYGWTWKWGGIHIEPTGKVSVSRFETWRTLRAGEKVSQNLHNWFSEAVSNLMQNTGKQIEKILEQLPETKRKAVIDKIFPVIDKINKEFAEVTYITQLEALRQQAPAVQNYIYTTFLPRLKQASAELMAVLEQAIRTATATVRRHTGVAGGIRGAGVSGDGEVSDLTLKLRKVSQDYAKDVLKAYTETLAKAEDVVRIYVGRTKFGQPVYWTGQWRQFTQARFRQMKEQYGLRDIPSDIINKMWDLRKKALYQQYMQLSKMQQGGTVKGPSSGYHFEAIFHGTEHIVPESQMKGIKEELRDIKRLMWSLLNTAGEQNKHAKRTYRILQKWDIAKTAFSGA